MNLTSQQSYSRNQKMTKIITDQTSLNTTTDQTGFRFQACISLVENFKSYSTKTI